LRYELVQDNYDKVKNRDQIERPEYFAMGTQASAQLGRALESLGSTQDLWLYTVSASDGFRLPADSVLLSPLRSPGRAVTRRSTDNWRAARSGSTATRTTGP